VEAGHHILYDHAPEGQVRTFEAALQAQGFQSRYVSVPVDYGPDRNLVTEVVPTIAGANERTISVWLRAPGSVKAGTLAFWGRALARGYLAGGPLGVPAKKSASLPTGALVFGWLC